MESSYKVPIPPQQLSDLVTSAKDYLLSHGAITRTRANPTSAEVVTYAPFVLIPSPVPRSCFEQAVSVQCDFNLLMHRVALDFHFLKSCLQRVIEVDDFTRRLWQIFETVHSEGSIKPVSLAMNRSDYMFHCEPPTMTLRQIEFNTVASSFAGLSQCIGQYHRHMLRATGCEDKMNRLPENRALQGLAEAMVCAWNQYANSLAVILFLVLPTEGNIYDQRWLEYAVNDVDSKVKIIRRTLQDIAQFAKMTSGGELMIDDMEIAVVYFRSGYAPDHFKTQQDWDARLLLERSRAVLCPSASYQLAGTKKVQQVLAEPGMLQRFLPPDAVARVRATFTGQYTLDWGEEGDKNIAAALQQPDKFVLKPQREGGGNNLFGEALRTLLTEIRDSSERQAYILMERVSPALFLNYPVTPVRDDDDDDDDDVTLSSMVSELGIFGTLVGTRDDIMLNRQHGHILRTKHDGVDEGGVASGYSVLDSPYLI